MENGDTRKQKILASIAARGWFTVGLYPRETQELRDAGLIKLGFRFSTGGYKKPVWIAA